MSCRARRVATKKLLPLPLIKQIQTTNFCKSTPNLRGLWTDSCYIPEASLLINDKTRTIVGDVLQLINHHLPRGIAEPLARRDFSDFAGELSEQGRGTLYCSLRLWRGKKERCKKTTMNKRNTPGDYHQRSNCLKVVLLIRFVWLLPVDFDWNLQSSSTINNCSPS